MATFRCAYEVPTAKIGDHRYQLWLDRELAFIIVAHLVLYSIASDDERVSEGGLGASDVPILNCKSFRATRVCGSCDTRTSRSLLGCALVDRQGETTAGCLRWPMSGIWPRGGERQNLTDTAADENWNRWPYWP